MAIVSAHLMDAVGPARWDALAALDGTIVILMGGRNLPFIVDEFLQRNKSPDTPVAVIRDAGLPEMKVWRGTLGSIVQLTKNESLSPCIILIGEVVEWKRFEDRLQASESAESAESAATGTARQ